MKKGPIHTSGKRKTAIARVTIKPGEGNVFINSTHIKNYTPRMARLRLEEPLILAGKEITTKIDISINVHGGGISSQTDAARLAIARALIQHTPKLKSTFLNYDRQLLVADVRRKEAKKPNTQGSARSKRQKSYR
ncbi:30S ribosomal protein S9 [Candidatus Woesearchaeota archaeon]|nr:30S ribosomal protein S9 [Candidatus Woesearchaeota archaeon]|tara:strand:- start:1042 stop:1446 length:405 start_codon:yes stop_codon:yes gene_type:complete